MIIWNFSLFLSTMYKCVKLLFLYQSMQMSKLVLFSLIIDIQLDYNIYHSCINKELDKNR